ncbi:MAG: hypothetical protein V7752_20950 [Halopseudomonas sp.]
MYDSMLNIISNQMPATGRKSVFNGMDFVAKDISESTLGVSRYDSNGIIVEDYCGKQWVSNYSSGDNVIFVSVNYVKEKGSAASGADFSCSTTDIATYEFSKNGLEYSGYTRTIGDHKTNKVIKKVVANYNPSWLILPNTITLNTSWEQELSVTQNVHADAANLEQPSKLEVTEMSGLFHLPVLNDPSDREPN